jgi:hypothetical protein
MKAKIWLFAAAIAVMPAFLAPVAAQQLAHLDPSLERKPPINDNTEESDRAKLRRVLLLAASSEWMSEGSPVDAKRRELIVYDVSCLDGHAQYFSPGFEIGNALAGGDVWVVRLPPIGTPSEGLRTTLDRVCRA